MIAIVRKNLSSLILKHISSPACRSPVSPHLFSTSRENICPRISDILLKEYDFPPELASQVSSNFSDLENLEKVNSVLSFFKENGFSNSELAKILKYKPRFLVANVEDTFKPKIKIFQEFGFSNAAICKLLSANPSLWHLSVDSNIRPSLSAIKGFLGSDYEVAGVLRNSVRLVSSNFESTVVPNVEFLKSCGVSMDRIRIMLANHPNPFLLKPEVTRKSVEKVKELGLDPSSKNFIYAIATIASMRNEAWELRLQGYQDMGFSESDVLAMFKKSPRMITGSMEKKRKIKELLLSTGKFDLSSIVNHPLALVFSIEKRLRPRLRVLEVLESRELIKEWPDLGIVCKLSDFKFCVRFISPYLNEIRNDDVIKNFILGKTRIKLKASA